MTPEVQKSIGVTLPKIMKKSNQHHLKTKSVQFLNKVPNNHNNKPISTLDTFSFRAVLLATLLTEKACYLKLQKVIKNSITAQETQC